MRLFLKYATERAIAVRSLKVAIVVGTILAAINHYDMFMSGEYTARRVAQIFLTYLVPYCVATYGGAMQSRDRACLTERSGAP